MGNRGGSCTSELHIYTASIAGCVPCIDGLFTGPCIAPNKLRRPVICKPICLVRPAHATTARVTSHLLHGKSALHELGLSLRLHAAKGSLIFVSAFSKCTWCCFMCCKCSTASYKYLSNHVSPFSIWSTNFAASVRVVSSRVSLCNYSGTVARHVTSLYSGHAVSCCSSCHANSLSSVW